MKKFFILLALSSVFFFGTGSYKANALTFTASDNKEHEVVDSETLRDYCYYTYFKKCNDCDNFVLATNRFDTVYFFYYTTGPNMKAYHDSSNKIITFRSTSSPQQGTISSVTFDKDTFEIINMSDNNVNASFDDTNVLYSNLDLNEFYVNSAGEKPTFFKANFTFEDIEKKYSTIEDKPTTGPTPSEEPSTDISSLNITREEFFMIPFLLAILICMLFFKWCFPMKGGKKI